MEGNKDEAQRCLEIGKQALRQRNYDKALKFFRKSNQLFSSGEAVELTAATERQIQHEAQKTKDKEENERKREEKHSKNDEPVATAQEHAEVQRVLKVRHDYYQVLQVPKSASEKDIIESYKKVSTALKSESWAFGIHFDRFCVNYYSLQDDYIQTKTKAKEPQRPSKSWARPRTFCPIPACAKSSTP